LFRGSFYIRNQAPLRRRVAPRKSPDVPLVAPAELGHEIIAAPEPSKRNPF